MRISQKKRRGSRNRGASHTAGNIVDIFYCDGRLACHRDREEGPVRRNNVINPKGIVNRVLLSVVLGDQQEKAVRFENR